MGIWLSIKHANPHAAGNDTIIAEFGDILQPMTTHCSRMCSRARAVERMVPHSGQRVTAPGDAECACTGMLHRPAAVTSSVPHGVAPLRERQIDGPRS